MLKPVLKTTVKLLSRSLAMAAMLPFAAFCFFGRIESLFQIFAQFTALLPGLIGDYLRVAFYVMTIDRCFLQSRISFGSFLAQSSARLGRSVYIGAYCVIGDCEIGDRTQIASHVQIVSGRYQHRFDQTGRLLTADAASFTPVIVGADCWLGASSIIMADVGPGTTVGAGSVVISPLPANAVAVGNPAKVIRQRQTPAAHTPCENELSTP